jgi:enoyl-CoA hydratase/carnithine racemase
MTTPTYDNILLERSGAIATITLNRPEKLNALSAALQADLRAAFDEIDADHDIRAVILTGAGRAFSSGYDIAPGNERPDMPVTAKWDYTHLWPKTVLRPWSVRQPVIAAVNGFAMAAGNVLAMACDIVLASDQAVFAEPEVRHVAHSPFTMLPLLGVAHKKLTWFYYTGDTLDAATAEQWGLVTKVVPHDRLMAEARFAAERIAMVPPFAVQIMKQSLRQTYDKLGFHDAFQHHLVLRMAEGLVPGVPEKDELNKLRDERGLKAFLDHRDRKFADQVVKV